LLDRPIPNGGGFPQHPRTTLVRAVINISLHPGKGGLLPDTVSGSESRATIVKAYNTVRGSALKHVKAVLPALGALAQKYTAPLAPVSQVPEFLVMPQGILVTL
jgi:hypothetical protein